MPKKISKAQAKYQSSPKLTKRCGNCSMFRAPDSCTLVTGTISASGYCIHWDKK